MQAEFARVGIEFERLPGIDGGALGEAALAAFASSRRERHREPWLPGEIGCFLSHSLAWERIAADDREWGVVFEDDVDVADDAADLLRSLDWIPADADVIRLEANRPMRLGRGIPIGAAPARRVHRALSGTAGSAGYILARDAARRLLAIPPALHTSVDVFLFKPKMSPVARALQRYQLVPAICIQESVFAGEDTVLPSLIRGRRSVRGRGYREHANPLLGLWPIRRIAVPFRR